MDTIRKTYQVEGMHCASCASSVEKSLMKVDGVESAVVNLPLENVRIGKDVAHPVSHFTLHSSFRPSFWPLVHAAGSPEPTTPVPNVSAVQ